MPIYFSAEVAGTKTAKYDGLAKLTGKRHGLFKLWLVCSEKIVPRKRVYRTKRLKI